jgi:AAA+ ATPase superfamily predicted ATPase
MRIAACVFTFSGGRAVENPFNYTSVVTGKAFCNRKKELADLLRFLRFGQNVLLYSHRRYGKTSLVHRVLAELTRGRPKSAGIHVDLYGTVSEAEFVRALLKGFSGVEPTADRLLKIAKRLFSGLRLRVTVDPNTGGANLSLAAEPGNPEALLDSAMTVLERYAAHRRLAVVLDEFQEVAHYAESGFEKRLRARIQHHANIAYVFCGSQRHLLTELFHDQNRAFYRIAEPYPIERIDSDAYIQWAAALFAEKGTRLDAALVREVVDRCENHPMYVQQFFFHLWSCRRPSTGDLDRIEAEILRRNRNGYFNLWEGLTLNQRKALKLVAATGGRKMYNAATLQQVGFTSGSQLKRALDALTARDILEKNGGYRIQDVLFARWVGQL